MPAVDFDRGARGVLSATGPGARCYNGLAALVCNRLSPAARPLLVFALQRNCSSAPEELAALEL
jgi:hypothetical protein